jgi:hypothetical protein
VPRAHSLDMPTLFPSKVLKTRSRTFGYLGQFSGQCYPRRAFTVAKSQAAGWDIGAPELLRLSLSYSFSSKEIAGLATPFEVCKGAHLDRIKYFAWFRQSLCPQRHGPEGRPLHGPGRMTRYGVRVFRGRSRDLEGIQLLHKW